MGHYQSYEIMVIPPFLHFFSSIFSGQFLNVISSEVFGFKFRVRHPGEGLY